MRSFAAAGAVALMLTSVPVFAQPAPITIIHAGRLLDRPGEAVRGPSTIVVENGRIARIESGFAAAPAGAR